MTSMNKISSKSLYCRLPLLVLAIFGIDGLTGVRCSCPRSASMVCLDPNFVYVIFFHIYGRYAEFFRYGRFLVDYLICCVSIVEEVGIFR